MNHCHRRAGTATAADSAWRITPIQSCAFVYVLSTCLFFLGQGGCAIRYFDEGFGVEHVWGFGHMAMRVTPPSEGLLAVVRSTDVFGIGVGIGSADRRLAAVCSGWPIDVQTGRRHAPKPA